MTQCLKVQASAAGGNWKVILANFDKLLDWNHINTTFFSVSGYTYSCNDKTEKEDGCHKVEQTIMGLSINAETCVCTGNLCNSASARGINFMLAFSCFMTALLKYVF